MRALVIALPLAIGGCFVTPPAPPCTAGQWAPSRRFDELATPDDEDGPWMSADRLHLVFSSNSAGVYRVLETSRADAASPFDVPVPLPELVADQGMTAPLPPDDRLEPTLSEDLRQIWLGRRTTYKDRDLVAATRSGPGAMFGAPSPASFDEQCMPDPCGVNSSNNDVDPAFSPDRMTVYFASDRVTGMSRYRLHVAAGTSPGLNWGPATLISSIAGTSIDRAPAISSDGETLLFESDRSGGREIFESDRTGPGLGDFGAPVPFAPLAAEGFPSGAPYILADGAIVFSSDHGAGTGRDLYLLEHCD